MTEYIKEVRAIVSDRLDLTKDLSDDDIREVISNIISEKSQEKYLSLSEKKAVMDLTSQTSRNHYFEKGEVEYIIFGNKSQVAKITACIGTRTLM